MPLSRADRTSYEVRRKKRRQKILIKRILAGLITVILTLSIILGGIFIYSLFFPEQFDSGFIPTPFGKNVSERVEKAESLVLPDWVDVQLIDFHTTARTGIKLTDIKNIVIHYVGNPNTSAQNNRNYFNKSDTTVSSHFVVGLEGEVIQCIPLYEKSAASNQRNKDTISIEVCHPDSTGEFSRVTYDSLIKLTAFLCNEFSLDESDVIRHYDITEKICPKYYVENEDAWEQMKRDIKESLDEY